MCNTGSLFRLIHASAMKHLLVAVKIEIHMIHFNCLLSYICGPMLVIGICAYPRVCFARVLHLDWADHRHISLIGGVSHTRSQRCTDMPGSIEVLCQTSFAVKQGVRPCDALKCIAVFADAAACATFADHSSTVIMVPHHTDTRQL